MKKKGFSLAELTSNYRQKNIPKLPLYNPEAELPSGRTACEILTKLMKQRRLDI
jgi:hypothetical protein